DGQRLAVVGDSGLATIWSVPGWVHVQSLRVSPQHAYRCRYSPDGSILATLGLNAIRMWNAETGEAGLLIRGASHELAFRPDGGRIAAGGDAGTVRLRDARRDPGATVYQAGGNLYDASFSGDGRRIIDAEGTVLDSATGAVVWRLPVPEGQRI